METKLGKIKDIYFGYGGYGDGMIGIGFTFSGAWGEAGDFWGDWSCEPSKSAKWTTEERNLRLGEIVMKLDMLLTDAKVDTLAKLKDVPIEIKFDGNQLKTWRILTEVI